MGKLPITVVNAMGFQRKWVEGASQFYSPYPKFLSQNERGALHPVPLLPKREKGLGDEGKR
jgi:hypothetical protein